MKFNLKNRPTRNSHPIDPYAYISKYEAWFEGFEKELRDTIHILEQSWKAHLEDDGGSCYCLANPDSCLPEKIRLLREILGE